MVQSALCLKHANSLRSLRGVGYRVLNRVKGGTQSCEVLRLIKGRYGAQQGLQWPGNVIP